MNDAKTPLPLTRSKEAVSKQNQTPPTHEAGKNESDKNSSNRKLSNGIQVPSNQANKTGSGQITEDLKLIPGQPSPPPESQVHQQVNAEISPDNHKNKASLDETKDGSPHANQSHNMHPETPNASASIPGQNRRTSHQPHTPSGSNDHTAAAAANPAHHLSNQSQPPHRSLHMSSTRSTLSSEDARLADLLPRIPELRRVRPSRPKSGIIIDSRYASSCIGKCSLLLVMESFIITGLVVFVNPECKQIIVKLQHTCIIAQVLAILSALSALFQIALLLLYTFHIVESFNQGIWLRFELTLQTIFTLTMGIASTLTLSSDGPYMWVGIAGIFCSFKCFIISMDRLCKIYSGKPAQVALDDADGNRTRMGIMRLRFGIRSIS